MQTNTCPACGAESEMDPRYVVWCPACEWNADPQELALDDTSWSGKRAATYGRRLHDSLLAGQSGIRHRGNAVALTAAAGTIWVLWLVIVAAGLWLVITFRPIPAGVILSIPVFGLAYLLRPRLGRIRRESLSRTDTPELYDLVDRISAGLDAPTVDHIVITDEFNASIVRAGFRRSIVLRLGAPLWIVLSPQARAALLGHELAHIVNGDPRRGFFVSGAGQMLWTVTDLLRPTALTIGSMELLTHWLLLGPRWLLQKLLRGFVGLGLRDGLRAEYLADEAAARLVGSEPMIELLDVSLLQGPIDRALRRAVDETESGRHGWDRIRSLASELPDLEMARLRLVSQRSQLRADESHPPTAMRRHYVEHLEATPRFELTAGESGRIDKALADVNLWAWQRMTTRVRAARFH